MDEETSEMEEAREEHEETADFQTEVEEEPLEDYQDELQEEPLPLSE